MGSTVREHFLEVATAELGEGGRQEPSPSLRVRVGPAAVWAMATPQACTHLSSSLAYVRPAWVPKGYRGGSKRLESKRLGEWSLCMAVP